MVQKKTKKKTVKSVAVNNITAKDLAYRYLVGYSSLQLDTFEAAPHHKLIAQKLEAVERGEIKRLMIFMPPRHGKPCNINDLCFMGDGSRKRLGDIKLGDMIMTHTGNPRKVLNVYEQGKLPCLKITTVLGQVVEPALDHPFLTPSGYKQAQDLTTDDYVTLLGESDWNPTATEKDEEFLFAGYMIGDGSCTHGPMFANGDKYVLNDFVNICKKLNFKLNEFNLKNHTEYSISKCRPWLRQHNLMGHNSRTKQIPEFIYRGSKQQISKFLAAYFECDGTVNKKGQKRKDCCIEYYSVNKQLLQDTQHLLLRFGIKSRLAIKNSKYKGEPYISYRLSILGHDDLAKFLDNIPIGSYKLSRLQGWKPVKSNFDDPKLPVKIKSIEKISDVECRCLNVEKDHTFTVNDIIVHNTLLTSEFFPAWYLGRNPKKQIIYATYSFERATDVGRKVRNQLVDPMFSEIFEGCQVSPDSKGANRLSTIQGGNYFSVGVGGAITGRGADILLIDDPIKGRKDAESETMRKQLQDWFQSVAYTRLMPGGAIIVIMTRWHFDDLAGFLLNEKAHEKWDVIELPAICEEPNDIIGRRSGEVLWLNAYPLPSLKLTRDTIGTRDWNALYQQRPVPEEGGMVQLEWFKRYDREEMRDYLHKKDKDGKKGTKSKFSQIVLSWDTAFKEGDLNDPSACTIWGIADDGYYLLWVFNRRLNFPKLKRKAIALHKQNIQYDLGAVPVLIEDKASGQSLIQELQEKTKIPIIPIKADANKKVRMSEVTALIEAGKVFLPKKASWLVDYESQMIQFPYGKFDDMVDSTSQFLRWAGRPKYVKSKKQLFWK